MSIILHLPPPCLLTVMSVRIKLFNLMKYEYYSTSAPPPPCLLTVMSVITKLFSIMKYEYYSTSAPRPGLLTKMSARIYF